MRKIFEYRLQGLVLLLALAGLMIVSSCEETMEGTDEVVLLSFGPVGVKHGDEISFIGQNLDKVTSIVFKPAVEVEASSFTSQTSDMIKVAVPQAAEAGTVILKTSQGDIETKTILNFEVPVVISNITAEARPGANITITGQKINWIESVTFTSDLMVEQADFVSQNATELVLTVPMEAQSGFLIFRTGGTEPLTFGSEEQLTVTLPAVTALNPTSIRHDADLTITGTDLDLVTELEFTEGGGPIASANFVSHSATQIVVKVPRTTETGTITLRQASPVEVVTDELTIILPAGTGISPSPTRPGIDEVTITGTNLDLVASLVLPGAGSIAASAFTAHSATEIKLNVPESATQGAIEYVTIHDYPGPLGVVLRLPPTGDFPVLDYYIYKEGLEPGWSAWGGWGHVLQDYNNEENPANGQRAIKSVFSDAYGAMQIHNDGAANIFAGYNYLVFYVHTNEDSRIIVQIDNNADTYPPAFTGGKYHQIVVPIADIAGANSVSELRIKNNNTNAPTTNTVVYIDEIGLTIDEPMGLLPDLVSVMFSDAVQGPFGLGGGWGGSTTSVSDEQQRAGSNSLKATFGGGWSGAGQFGAWGNAPLSTAGMENLAFSIYGGTGVGTKTLQINLIPTSGGTAASTQVTIEEGKWIDFQIPLTTFNNPASIFELQFQDTGWAGTVFIDHVGLQ